MANETPSTAELLKSVSREDVLAALKDIDSGKPHVFGRSVKYDLIHEGKRYAPKAVLGIAAQIRSGRTVSPQDFSGGARSETFRNLQRLGFKIVPKDETVLTTTLPAAPTGRIWMEITDAPGNH